MSPATALLVPLFAVVVIFALLAMMRLVRAWREADGRAEVYEDPEILALEDEKQRLFATLRDLDHENSLGKLSEADHSGLKRHFEREAVRVMDRLEVLRAERDAEREAEAALESGGRT